MTADLASRILDWAADDWVPLFAVVRFVKATRDVTLAEALERSLSTIAHLADDGRIVLGQVTEAGFTDWRIDTEAALASIRTAATEMDEDTWGFICWLRLATAGDNPGPV